MYPFADKFQTGFNKRWGEWIMRLCRFKIYLASTPIILLSLLFGACMQFNSFGERGSGKVITEQRDVSGISAVNLATIGRMTIEVGNVESLRVEAEDNLMQYLKTDVSNGELTIKNRDLINLNNTKPIRYFLTVKNLDSISISSSGDIQAPDLESRAFSINISSTGNLDIGALKADRLNVNRNPLSEMAYKMPSSSSQARPES